MAINEARCGRLARAMASDTLVYMKDSIVKGLEEDNLFDVLADNMEENRKAFIARMGEEAANTNILECAIIDTLVVPMGEQGKYPIF